MIHFRIDESVTLSNPKIVGVSFGIYKIVECRKKNVGVQEETAFVSWRVFDTEV